MSLVMNVLRSTDLLNLQFEFLNLKIDESGSRPVLRRDSPGAAHIILRLPAQHIAEHAVLPGIELSTPYGAALSGPSRLAFRLQDETQEVALTLQEILRLLARLPPVLPNTPLAPGAATVIEFPYHLLLVPEDKARLHHSHEPPSDDTIWAEVWQTGLHDGSGGLRFQPIPYPNDQDALSPTTLHLQDRLDIVTRSATDPTGSHVLVADEFMLSALGASVKLRSAWTDGSAATTLAAWSHEASLGRDRHVRTVREGFLFPFGHRAAIETITQREFSGAGARVAELRQKLIVALRERERTYQGRDMPLKSVQLNSVPTLRDDGTGTPEIGPYRVDATVVDLAGNSINCVLTTLFIPFHKARNRTEIDTFISKYLMPPDADPDRRLNIVDLHQQRLVLAEDPDNRGGTDFSVSTLTLAVKLLNPADVGPVDPLFAPVMESAEVSIPAVEQLKGAIRSPLKRADRALTAIRLSRTYLDRGIDRTDTKQIFAEIIEPIEGLEIPADRAGGLASPKFPPMDGLSRLMGPVSDVQHFDAPRPEQLIGDTKLLGMIPLKELVDLSESSDLGFLTEKPEDLFARVDEVDFVLRRPVIATVRTGPEIETRFVWKPKIKDVLPGGLVKQREPPSGPANPLRPPGKMQLIVRGRTKLAPAAEKADLHVEGRLTNFVISLAGLVNVEFNQVEFISTAGRKMEVKTSIAKVGFEGALAFAEEIRKAIPIGGLGNASISPQPDGIVARYGLGLPALSLGVLSLQQIVFNTSVALPFVEKPVGIRFALSERSKPFLVSVAPFGGTGFFALEMRTGGPNRLLVEGAIEFGGVIAFNLLDIIKGGVYVLAGVYVAIRFGTPPDISAHLRLGGFVDVLGLVSVSIELYLALEFRDQRLAGMAKLTIGVKILFFSQTFSFEVRKEIAHLGAIPRDRIADFRVLVDQSQWESYCRAFA